MSKIDPAELAEQLRDRVQLGMPHTIDRLARLVRIPSVSWDAFDPAHVAESAERVRELFEGTGLFDEVSVHQYEISEGVLGQPGVIARRPAAEGWPTVLLYAHHDVQPQGSDDKWDTPPFEPTLIGDRLYGRGASDDKAGVLLHVAALEAIRDIWEAAGEQLGLGISVFIEGEEENGSGSFSKFLDAHRDALGSDYIIVADSDNASVDVPALTVALRGNVTFNLTVRTLRHASHSGMFGGAAPDAMLATVRLLNTLWNDDGSVAVAGLESHDAPVPEHDEAKLIEEAGVIGGELLGSGPVLARTWYQPAITVTGIDAPDVANASNTLIPEVRVRVSARIAPGTDADAAAEAILDHLRANTPFGAELEFDSLGTGRPFLVDVDGDGVERMRTAMTEAWGAKPQLSGIGGSIPFIADLVDRFPHSQILVTGVEDPATRAHSPNESQHLGVLHRAILAEAWFLADLATQE
jgi:acetylornithine deacetylase/succinyl-diaminopimelate desuccinylase-like protein